MGTQGKHRLGHGYWMLFASVSVSSLGDGLRLVAMPLLALSLTHSAVDISLVMVVAALPGLLVGPLIGVMVDRLDRRRILTAAHVVRAGLVLCFATVIVSDRTALWQVYAMTAALSVAELFAESATFALISLPVPPELLEKANSRFFSARMLTQQVLGSPLAGVLFGVAVCAPFFAEGGLFAVAALVSLLIPVLRRPGAAAEPQAPPAPDGPRPSVLAQLREAVGIIGRYPLLRTILVSEMVLNFWMLIATALMVVYAKRDLGLTDTQYTLLFSAAALGSVLGGLLAPVLVRRLGVEWTMALALLATGLSRLALGLTTGPWLATATFFSCGAAVFVWDIAAASYQQRVTPNHLQGRMLTTLYAFSYGAAVVAALTGGLLSELIGVRAVVVVGAAAVLLIGAYWLRLALRGRPPSTGALAPMDAATVS
ncbi:MFS transporter [Streptacidiphilus sp. PB12-B1b]|uniref:MFS transporter n=1 Tax=Streptacidiphilus sp. PB12-B1b TaxID=2705012 RepID=UPI0015F8CC69|nr:MFS transporter [Streptacidiphilus sp. PB12-B1b]QMU75408.1 MFS transporter [Streptacidiphilus sp. PB12-B1b]